MGTREIRVMKHNLLACLVYLLLLLFSLIADATRKQALAQI